MEKNKPNTIMTKEIKRLRKKIAERDKEKEMAIAELVAEKEKQLENMFQSQSTDFLR